MVKPYEYKCIRLGKGWFWPKSEADTYKEVIEKYARQGWKLVQIFAQIIIVRSEIRKYDVILKKFQKLRES